MPANKGYQVTAEAMASTAMANTMPDSLTRKKANDFVNSVIPVHCVRLRFGLGIFIKHFETSGLLTSVC